MLKMICSLRLYRLCDIPANTKVRKQMLILQKWVQRRRVLSDDGSGRRCLNRVCDQSSRLWSKKLSHSPAKLWYQYFFEWEERKSAVKCSYRYGAVRPCSLTLPLPVVILFYVFAPVDLFVWGLSEQKKMIYIPPIYTPSFSSSFLSSP